MTKNCTGKFDVLIVGGGPAGSTAGYILSKLNFKVLIIEKALFPRTKLCGGFITHKTLRLLNRIFGETETSLEKNNILNFKSNQYEVFFKDKLLTKNLSNIPFHFVDRQIYDQFLLEKAKKIGAEIIEADGAKTIDINSNEIITSKGRKFKAKFIIGADGANSIIRKEIFSRDEIGEHEWSYNLATGFEIFVDRTEINRVINHPIIFFGFVKDGYAWIFPNKDKLLVGLGGLNRKNKFSFLNEMNEFLIFLKLNKKRLPNIVSHPVPYGNFLAKPVFRNIMLIGDSAGFVDPLIGEGIFYAQRSAEFASQAIYDSYNDKNLEIAYIQLLKMGLYPELVYAKKMRWLIFYYFNKLYHPLMKISINLLEEKLIELIHGIRTYKWLKKRKGIYEAI